MANFNLNKAILGGRLVEDPELKTTPSGIQVTTFTVAVNRRFSGKNGEETQADFIRVVAWRETATFITRFFRKSSSICVVGSIQTRSWVNQNGEKRFSVEVAADEVYFVDSKADSERLGVGTNSGNSQGGASAASTPAAGVFSSGDISSFGEIEDDDVLPF